MVKGDALGDSAARALAARTASVPSARLPATARTVEAAGVGGEYVDAVPGRGERAHGLVDVDVHPSASPCPGWATGEVEGEDRNAHGDSLANDLGRSD